MITAVPGIRVGHWTDAAARTGCTAIVLPAGAVVSGEIRGGAPGSREWALLEPTKRVDHVDAVVLTGGSAFGLAACDGVMRWCEEQGLGFPTSVGPVPIVVGLVVFDLAVGDAAVRPGPTEGYAAAASARPDAVLRGPVGAGTGCTIAKVRGPDDARPAGLGSGLARHEDVVVAVLAAVNAFGDLRPAADWDPPRPVRPAPGVPPAGGDLQSTTIGLVATNARLDKVGCLLVAQSAHDGLARALDPVHTGYDGDGFVVAATGEVDADLEVVRALAATAVEAAVRDGAGELA